MGDGKAGKHPVDGWCRQGSAVALRLPSNDLWGPTLAHHYCLRSQDGRQSYELVHPALHTGKGGHCAFSSLFMGFKMIQVDPEGVYQWTGGPPSARIALQRECLLGLLCRWSAAYSLRSETSSPTAACSDRGPLSS